MNESITGFFRRGQHGDVLIFKQYGGGASVFTMAQHDAENAPRIADQFRRMDADHLIHAEKVVLQAGDSGTEEVVVVTDLPLMRQTVIGIASGEEKKLRHPVQTETLTAISAAILALGATVEKQ